ncbi:DUF3331 domain-containing protein [Burkholderia arboris]|uniref:DUF3331 domain-containing protein n=1 Tax=Burkholderia arboris TaxID=488730 RepID=UPI001CF582BF|nr:DUF3331 domain-containing protein [Burkholderia arboris]MCA8032088.1 DUF3331 domain-containing protein [Burkholderia arboris]
MRDRSRLRASRCVHAGRNVGCACGRPPRSGGPSRFVDRVSATAVTIAWHDSTHCSYGDQAWHATRARTSAVCAISGRSVLPGDAVYQPRGRPRPLNADAMILASALHEAEENR